MPKETPLPETPIEESSKGTPPKPIPKVNIRQLAVAPPPKKKRGMGMLILMVVVVILGAACLFLRH
jgi:hypothetical protein